MQIRRRHPNRPVEVDILRYQVKVPDAEPKHILEKIVWHKELEIDKMRARLSLLELRKQVLNAPSPQDFLAALRESKYHPALIAEVKKASPSKGVIRENFDPVAIAKSYQQGGASCISVLTDKEFFQGSFENLELVRQAVDLPLLCKEFVIYPYQIYLARTKGADAILLIAAILNDRDLQYFVKIVNSLGMTPLIEVHTLEELDRVLAIEGVRLIGINNRNLENFSVDLQTTCKLLELRGETICKRGIQVVSESGFHTNAELNLVKEAGADAILIGESLVKQPNPDEAIAGLYANS
ncbi:MAG: indole-3-glycerol phosphate synthase TrpC [Prochloraceae cyanobacterium]